MSHKTQYECMRFAKEGPQSWQLTCCCGCGVFNPFCDGTSSLKIEKELPFDDEDEGWGVRINLGWAGMLFSVEVEPLTSAKMANPEDDGRETADFPPTLCGVLAKAFFGWNASGDMDRAERSKELSSRFLHGNTRKEKSEPSQPKSTRTCKRVHAAWESTDGWKRNTSNLREGVEPTGV